MVKLKLFLVKNADDGLEFELPEKYFLHSVVSYREDNGVAYMLLLLEEGV
jgi:hypothetical protein